MGQKINQKGNSNPGPGQYDPSDITTKNKIQTYKMSTSIRSKMINSKSICEMPGPGNYDLDNKNSKSTAYTFGTKNKQ